MCYVLQEVFGQEEEGEKDSEPLCMICYTDPPNCILLPCRHFCIDKGCAQAIDQRAKGFECPMCRTAIDKIIWIKENMKNKPVEK